MLAVELLYFEHSDSLLAFFSRVSQLTTEYVQYYVVLGLQTVSIIIARFIPACLSPVQGRF